MARLPFFSDCVGWPRDRLAVLELLVDNGVEVGVDWFAQNVDAVGVSGYWPLTELIADARKGVFGTTFYRLPGEPVFWATNSAIEYVFATPETIAALQAKTT